MHGTNHADVAYSRTGTFKVRFAYKRQNNTLIIMLGIAVRQPTPTMPPGRTSRTLTTTFESPSAIANGTTRLCRLTPSMTEATTDALAPSSQGILRIHRPCPERSAYSGPIHRR